MVSTTHVMERNYSLDAARGILMMLGILLHTANIYSLNSSWLIADQERSSGMDFLIAAVHVFRMPAFFWISGYFFMMTYQRNGIKGLLKKRLPRLLIPLITTWAVLNTTQEYLLALYEGRDPIAAVADGVPLYHLWFLIDLSLFNVCVVVIIPWLNWLGRRLEYFSNVHWSALFVALAVLSVLTSAIVRMSGVAYQSLLGLTSLWRLSSYAPYFVVGTIMFSGQDSRRCFLSIPGYFLLITVPMAIFAEGYITGRSEIFGEFALFVSSLMTWLSIAATLSLFHKYVYRESSRTRFLSDSSYSIFLFHHGIVVALGVALIHYPIGAWIKFALICCATFFLCASIHLKVIRPFRYLRLLFNGK